jgi:hypothetical protein
MNRMYARCGLLAMALLLGGCGSLPYKLAGDQLMVFGKKEMAPYLMTFDDVPMLCGTAESLTPLLMTFEAVGTDPDQMAVLVYMGAGLCAETDAFEEELRYMRALRQGNFDEARDARVAQKRAHALAARRQQVSYLRFLSYYGDLPEGQCSKKLKTDIDELIYLLGMVSGVKALLNDVQSDNAVGVDKDIAPKILYWTQCLDSAKWWELPSGMRSTVWNFVPMLAPDGATPMDDLARVAKVGEAAGVRLAHAIWALSAYGNGDMENTRRSIREFSEAAKKRATDPRYRILDAVATEIIMGISDRIWTEAGGTRTPPGALGTFPGDLPKSAGNIDDLL